MAEEQEDGSVGGVGGRELFPKDGGEPTNGRKV